MAVCLLMMSMAASAITINKALLQHNGEVTLFDGDSLQAAVDAATDGDTIYLTLGTFKQFTVNKKITIRGTGETSIIDGHVDIAIPGTPTLTSPVLEALAVSGTITVKSAVNDLIIRKCKAAYMSFSADVDKAVIDRCYITNTLYLSSYIKGMTVVNTKLYAVEGTSSTRNTTFVNCNFRYISTNHFAGTIINSVINSTSNQDLSSTVILNSLINTHLTNLATSSVTQGCYYIYYYGDVIVGSNVECIYTAAELQSKGYLGTDGKEVGIYGGDTPYTLKPSVPTVTSSSLDLDTEKKVLNVKLTVSPQ